MNITNDTGINLALAVWLVHDDYDYVNMPNYISATALLKPIRQIILNKRIESKDRTVDVSDLIASALGHSLHDSIEKAWKMGYKRNLALLGYPEKLIERVLINPEKEALKPDSVPIYLEQRGFIQLNGYTIGGKFDMVAEGIVHDNKSTSAYTWLYGGRDEEHCLQGSIYRLIHPEKITEDFIRICYIFTDWQKATAKQNPNYPQSRVATKDIMLMSKADTEKWILTKLALIEKYKDAPEEEIPECTDEELWRSQPVFKYYSDPAKTSGRSTRTVETLVEAREYMASKGGKGVIITVPGEPKRCGYCAAFDICKQKDKYLS